jgi:hypothetical protein
MTILARHGSALDLGLHKPSQCTIAPDIRIAAF